MLMLMLMLMLDIAIAIKSPRRGSHDKMSETQRFKFTPERKLWLQRSERCS